MENSFYRETRDLEFKRIPPGKFNKKTEEFKSYLKTVSAFANYIDGRIIFGVTDRTKQITPVEDPEQFILDLENQINDGIRPIPSYRFSINEDGTVVLYVKKGSFTPYLYRGIAYRRLDSSSLPVDRDELKRLSWQGSNISFEDLPASKQDLHFEAFRDFILNATDIQEFSDDILKTFSLYSDDGGFTNAALLLSDENTFPTAGLIGFGSTISEIRLRKKYEGVSVLRVFDEINDLFLSEYSYESIEQFRRIQKVRIPIEAFRESIANALVHRDWSISAEINVSFYSDRVEITSPGALPHGITPEEYLNRMISICRNQHLAFVFNRIGVIERFGTGIMRIRESYKNSVSKPDFLFSDQSVTVILPVTQSQDHLSEPEIQILAALKSGPKKKKELVELTDQSNYQILKALNDLIERKLIQRSGQTRNVTYSLVE